MKIYALMWVIAAALTGCVNHINPYAAKQRPYEFLPEQDVGLNRTSGSLWSEDAPANDLIADNRARRIGDMVIVVVEESASATQDTALSTSREASKNANVQAFLGVMKQLRASNGFIEQATDNGGNLIDMDAVAEFTGQGSGSRNQQMTATVPAIVKKVSPRGNLLFIEGYRTLLVNNEEHHFYISGVVRKNDINNLNRISSTEMAEAEIEFTGRGDMSAGSEKGWFTRVTDFLWPF